jgi:hypothetical protein
MEGFSGAFIVGSAAGIGSREQLTHGKRSILKVALEQPMSAGGRYVGSRAVFACVAAAGQNPAWRGFVATAWRAPC